MNPNQERRGDWFNTRGRIAVVVTLVLHLITAVYFAGRLTAAVEGLEDQVFALTQRVARIEDQYFKGGR
jgi:hypothetical protein